MQGKLHSKEHVISLIKEGRHLALSADESILKELPKGNWIGGTIPYFLDEKGGIFTKDQIMVTDFSEISTESSITLYDESNLSDITRDAFDNGFSFLILPALQPIHLEFALNSPDYDNLFKNPLVGLIAGVALEEIGHVSPKVFYGATGEFYENKGVALHVALPDDKVARLEIVNIFEPDKDGPILEFNKDDFSYKEVLIDGKLTNFAEYIEENNIDIRNPLVADYSGAHVNVSFQSINEDNGDVVFYAPLFEGRKYYLAKPIGNYVETFKKQMPENDNSIQFTCNCILNYLYGELENKKIGFRGPITFGEIAYQLLNQTFTYLVIE